jgi:hypothetical protein
MFAYLNKKATIYWSCCLSRSSARDVISVVACAFLQIGIPTEDRLHCLAWNADQVLDQLPHSPNRKDTQHLTAFPLFCRAGSRAEARTACSKFSGSSLPAEAT